MKRNVLSVMASVLIAGALVSAQNAPAQEQAPAPAPQAPASAPAAAPTPAAPAQDADDVTFKGCLIQGSTPTTFILENAKSDAPDAKAHNFVVEIQAQPDQIKSIVNTHVQVTGTADKVESDDSKTRDEKDMPKLTAKRITRLAATCPATGD
jgi:hypothetical protein